jgi:membrane protein
MAMDQAASRGRQAAAPAQIPASGWKDVLARVYDNITEHRILAIAAAVTFYVLLAIFPAIAAFVALYSLFADPSTIGAHLQALSGFLPKEGLAIIDEQLRRVSAQGGAALGLASVIGLLVSLWSANAGMKAIFDALNVVYQEREKRGFFRLNAITRGFTLAGMAAVAVALGVMVILPPALEALGLRQGVQTVVEVLRWPALLVVVALAISIVYRYGPSRDEPRWRWVSWGGAFAAIAWRRFRCSSPGMRPISEISTEPTARSARPSASCCGCGCHPSCCRSEPNSTPNWSIRPRRTRPKARRSLWGPGARAWPIRSGGRGAEAVSPTRKSWR